ncbi:MAG: hydroxymethylbilane synthase [Ignavibacteria bacterium]|nr:hydroxymethylbilane synthase [Ignavibacteria bacterium]
MSNLSGRTIISTKPLSDEDYMKDYFISRSANYLWMPLIEILPSRESENIKYIFQNLENFDWVLFTSKNGVEYFFRYFHSLQHNNKFPEKIKLAAIGDRTALELQKFGFTPDFISNGTTSKEFLRNIIIKYDLNGKKILLALGELAKNTLEAGLQGIAEVTRINVYRTVPIENYSKEIIHKIKSDNYDIIIFTSPSGFEHFLDIAKIEGIGREIKFACIGTTTCESALNQGYKPLLVSSKPDGLIFAQEIEELLLKN